LLILSNAGGGLNPMYQSGDLVVIDDHINLMFRNPLIGINDDQLGPRFPDMSRPYHPQWIDSVLQIARRSEIPIHQGVYAGLSGPTYETRAEYRMLRRLGADVVGMSTVPETTVAVHAGIPVVAVSVITNVCKPDFLDKTAGEEVVLAARNAEPKLRQIVREVIGLLAHDKP
jgi:purine-nucleoside phosphorylase